MYSKLSIYIFSLLVLNLTLKVAAQALPVGYELSYKKSAPEMLSTLTLSPQARWQLSRDKRSLVLGTLPTENADSVVPASCGFIANQVYGEYRLEMELRLEPNTSPGSAGFYFLGPVKNCNTYYAFCFTGDSVRFCYVEKGKDQFLKGMAFHLNPQQWNKIRIERDLLNRSIRITNTTSKQSISFSDRRLVMGYVGFGTQHVDNQLRNLCIWAPTVISENELHCE